MDPPRPWRLGTTSIGQGLSRPQGGGQ